MDERLDPRAGSPRKNAKTPEPRLEQQIASGRVDSPGTPSVFVDFDWAGFEARYTEALERADGEEVELMREFDELVKYFHNWAASARAHDAERAAKRLQTRQRFVNISEESMEKRQQHMNEVLQAFQSALALLRQT